MQIVNITTKAKEEIVDITAQVSAAVAQARIRDGLCLVASPHTTAGLALNENADPAVKSDVLLALGRAVPDNYPYRHREGNSPAHVKAAVIGSSITLIVEEGRLRLGTWQGVYFCEFDGPRRRQVWVKCLASSPGARAE